MATQQAAATVDARRADPAWAWARYVPDAARPFNLRMAGHLWRRAGFGATWGDLQRALADGPQKTIDRLLRPEADVAYEQQVDAWESSSARSGDVAALAAWWLRRAIETPHPLRERLTLCWHGHFAVAAARVESAPLMDQYVKLLRRHALGRFDQMFAEIARDPATLVGLGAAANRRGMPSEHFAATLLGPFSLGEGACSPADVRDAARAFTGQFVQHGRLRFVEREHDPGVKRLLGEEGPLGADDVPRIVLRQPALPRRMVGRLYRWLISESEPPGEELLAPLVEAFAADFDIGRLVETMLRSNWFFSAAAYRQRVKSPVEFAVGLIRSLESLVPTLPLARQLSSLGQELLNPPTVHGWAGGRAWITRTTLIARGNLAQSLLSGGQPYGDAMNPAPLAEKHGHREPAAAGPFFLDLLVQGDVAEEAAKAAAESLSDVKDRANALRHLVYAIATLPEFQLS